MHLLLLDFRDGSCRQVATCRNPLAARLIIKRAIKGVWKAPFKRDFKLSYAWAQTHTTTFQEHLNQRSFLTPKTQNCGSTMQIFTWFIKAHPVMTNFASPGWPGSRKQEQVLQHHSCKVSNKGSSSSCHGALFFLDQSWFQKMYLQKTCATFCYLNVWLVSCVCMFIFIYIYGCPSCVWNTALCWRKCYTGYIRLTFTFEKLSSQELFASCQFWISKLPKPKICGMNCYEFPVFCPSTVQNFKHLNLSYPSRNLQFDIPPAFSKMRG